MIILQAPVDDDGMSLFYTGSMGARTVTGSSKTKLILIRFSYTYFLIKIMVMILMVVVMMTNDACKAHIALLPLCVLRRISKDIE